MVRHGDFTVQLIDAESKIAFPEHTKDGKIYVEVEPDTEYFISIQKTGNTVPGYCLCKFLVDEQDLGYLRSYSGNKKDESPTYSGVWHLKNGVSTHQALKFIKPSISAGNGASRLLMGKVEVHIHEGIFRGYRQRTAVRNGSFKAASVGLNQGAASKKKSLRSDEGTTTLAKTEVSNQEANFKSGKHLDTITLNYCAAVGLIEVGVLPKPGMWEYHRMKRPAEPTGAPKTELKKIRINAKENELFDLSAVNSDEED